MQTVAENSPGQRKLADLPARIAFAVPTAAFAVALLIAGGGVFAAGVAAIGALAAWEACRLLHVPAPVAWAALAGVVAMAVAAQALGRDELIGVLAAGAAVVAAVGVAVGRGRTVATAGGVLALCWIGLGVAHAVLLRELPHGGGLLLDVLLAVFIGDTAAHLLGSLYGRRPMAPTISPNKTLEGLAAGLITAPLVVMAVAAVGQDWLELWQALVLGLAAGIAAPAGDLFESALKREAGVKDSGALLGPHGGMLDRVDAVLVAVVAGYWVAVALL